MTKINIILGSSRKSSIGRHLFNYLKNNQSEYEKEINAQLNFIEIGQYELPFFYEALPPMNNKNRSLPDNEQKWLDDMADADGYIFLTPEYNHSFPAVIKNAIDYLSFQMSGKAVLTMTYSNNARGGQFGGLELNEVLTRLNAFVVPQNVAIGNVQKNFDENGNFLEDAPSKEFYENKLKQSIKKIIFYSNLFKENPFKG
ncbi:NAD(P)H-dependent oxidoreductase [Apilactobacillus apisilvae]|uniref:NAD(P)H-dependent oxidoreductase n=1 Tax=Apilactobacillus apisilvae TaxID=2923364 RepID=A0ABY4PGH1_9LACO|nr:NAD(P)H-dependent oxidoreductase [Apilactobacillus apisilvae]UQS84773.1 NAD(P)H-dependent oxidoreductase [Apilactobacillus apisilvae]